MATSSETKDWDSNEEIKHFREYLRIPSVHPNIDYEPCLKFLHCQACCLELPMRVYYPVNERNPVVILTWCGTDPGKKSILLNSHMDVVPVFEDNWTHPPFGAEIDGEGKIFARGTQDMKCVGMQYLAAIRSLKKSGARFKRTVHISFVPDEEMGGKLGMRAFVQTKEFRDLNVGFALDEGIATPTDTYPVFYAERSVWRIYFKICGNAGHGSLLLKNTAAEKLQLIINNMMDMRLEEVKRLDNNPEFTIGDVTTINLTRINGGVQSNVIPTKITACFDVRLALDVNLADFEAKLNSWCEEAGGDIKIEYEQKRPRVEPTKIDDTNPFWIGFQEATDAMGLKIKLQTFPGGTDSRYIRELGIPALGFSPMANTPVLLHDNDEYLAVDTFLKDVLFKINGSSGHGVALKEKTAAEKLKILLTKMMCLRQQEVQRLEANPTLNVGDVTSINMTRVYGGVENNVLPSRITACFDIRLALYVDQDEFDAKLKNFCRAAGGNIEMEYEDKAMRPVPTVTDKSNQFWTAFKQAMDEMELKMKLQIFPGCTDSRFLRSVGIPVLGFSPLIETPVLMHENDEYIKAATFLKGIEIYETLIAYLADSTKCYCALKRSILWDGAKAQLSTASKPKEPEKPTDSAVNESTTELLKL